MGKMNRNRGKVFLVPLILTLPRRSHTTARRTDNRNQHGNADRTGRGGIPDGKYGLLYNQFRTAIVERQRGGLIPEYGQRFGIHVRR